jgi:hypothetical protein
MAKRPLPLGKVYRLIEPGPVVLVSTSGRANIMTMSWHMMVDFEPPIIACVMSNRDYSFEALKKTRERPYGVLGRYMDGDPWNRSRKANLSMLEKPLNADLGKHFILNGRSLCFGCQTN